MSKRKYSPSQLKVWGECSLRAKFQYVDGLKKPDAGSSAYLGTAVHYALEQLHNGNAQPEEIEQIFLDFYDSDEPDYIVPRTTYSGLRDSGKKMIAGYLETWGWQDIEILGVEKRFMVPYGQYSLSGMIDLLYIYDNKLYIIDLKTGKKPSADKLHLDIQGTSYDYAVQRPEFWLGVESDDPEWPDKYAGWENGQELYERTKNMQRVPVWYDLRDNREIPWGERTQKDYARLYRLMEMIDRAIETETYVPTIDPANCNWCPYHEECPVYWEETSVSI